MSAERASNLTLIPLAQRAKRDPLKLTARTRLGLLTAIATAACLLAAGPAAAQSPWWQLSMGSRPAHLPTEPGQEADLFVAAENVGDASLDAEASPVAIAVSLPPGLEAVAISANAPLMKEYGINTREALHCSLATLSCAFESTLAPYDTLEFRLKVAVKPGAHSGEEFEATVSGGDAAAKALPRPLAFSGEPTPFGLDGFRLRYEEEGGALDTQAGSHPFQFTTTVALNQGPDRGPIEGFTQHERRPFVAPVGQAKTSYTKFPPGFIGDPLPVPACTLAQFLTVAGEGNGSGPNPEEDKCPPSTAIGVASVAIFEPLNIGYAEIATPLFNLEPYAGEPARFGFYVSPSLAATPVVLDTSLRSGAGEGAIPGQSEDYGIDVNAINITQTAGLIAARVTTWGTPADPRHDKQRGWGCIYEARGPGSHSACPESSEEGHPPAFLTLPTSCLGPMQASQEVSSWEAPSLFDNLLPDEPLPALESCNRLSFAPTIHAEPTTGAATSPTGLNFDLSIPNEGLTSSKEGARAASELKKAIVSLPQGFSTNPSVAEGLKACSLEEFHKTTIEPGSGCSEESKIGSAEIESPVVRQTVKGSLFVAKQTENPYGSLLTLYLVFRNQELGILVKQALKVTPDPETGQLTTEVDNIPQLPFSHFRLSFRQGQRSPLVTPPACGTYTVTADLFSWSDPSHGEEETSSFEITQGPEGQGCPSGGVPPFHPNLEAGTINNAAGTYSPFNVHMSRRDSEQEITHFSIKLPPGVVGKLAGIPFCSDAGILQAQSREVKRREAEHREEVFGGGGEEEANPSCPAASEVGHTLVGTGVGNVLAYAPGKLYLAGPYHGAPISIVSITAAKVGPFDLGTVVVREALKVNPETAEVFVDATGSDPIPHIVAGIPVHLRDIRVYVNRPEFVLNPTSCEPTSTASTVLGSGLNFASEADDQPVTVTSPFQAADCASLPFHPKLKLSLKGSTKRGATPAFKAFLTMKPGEANISRSVVVLPRSEFLDNAHIGTSCTRVQFNAGKIPGEDCPAASVYGHAKAITPILDEPIEGPVFLRSNGGERNLPDLVAALHSGEININLVGFIDSIHHGQIRNRFQAVPDAPVTSFTLEMMGGKKGLLENAPTGSARTLCESKNSTSVEFEGHNGKRSSFNTELKPLACHKHKKSKHGKKKHRRARR